jgi:hypothetical protein
MAPAAVLMPEPDQIEATRRGADAAKPVPSARPVARVD